MRGNMSEYDELVKILRDGGWRGAEAADALEAMTEQRDRFVERFNEARLALQAAEAERDRLKAALEPFAKLSTDRERQDPPEGTMRVRVVTAPEIEAARKALGGDAS